MYNKDIIIKLLNIDSSKIQDITTINQEDNSIKFRVKLIYDGKAHCPICAGNVLIHGYKTHQLKHSTFIDRDCTIEYDQRRFKCRVCGKTFFETSPFNEPSTRITYETKINALKALKKPDTTFTSVARLLNITPTQSQRIFDRHVSIDRKPLPKVLCMDEHYFPSSDKGGPYMCLLLDFQTRTLVDVLPDRRKDYLCKYFSDIRNSTLDGRTGWNELRNVEYVSMDMYEPYKEVVSTYFPSASICIDSWHVLSHLADSFKAVRISCQNSTQDLKLQSLLFNYRRIFRYNYYLDNDRKYISQLNRYANNREIMNTLFERFPDLEKAYRIFIAYMDFNRTAAYETAPQMISDIIELIAKEDLRQFDDFYNMLIRWQKEIINSFICVDGKRINNSIMESVNSQVQMILITGFGYSNFKRLRNRILYCVNKKDTFKI